MCPLCFMKGRGGIKSTTLLISVYILKKKKKNGNDDIISNSDNKKKKKIKIKNVEEDARRKGQDYV